MPHLRTIFYQTRDCIFPFPTPFTAAENEAQAKQSEHAREAAYAAIDALQYTQDLTPHVAACRELLTAEKERRQSVEARLTTIIGLSSIAGTIVLGTMFTPNATTGVRRYILAVGLWYLALQVCCAIFNAVLGLGRRSYLAALPENVLPEKHEATSVHARRQMRASVDMLFDHHGHNNTKVSHMADAHRAMTNFLVAFLLLALLGMWHLMSSAPRNELLERLKSDYELRELLRGPQGTQGLPGPTGLPGPAGPPGSVKDSGNTNRRPAQDSK